MQNKGTKRGWGRSVGPRGQSQGWGEWANIKVKVVGSQGVRSRERNRKRHAALWSLVYMTHFKDWWLGLICSATSKEVSFKDYA